MTTTENSLIFKDLFNEGELFRNLRSDMQLDLNQKPQIVQNTDLGFKTRKENTNLSTREI